MQVFFGFGDNFEETEFKDINDYVALGCDLDHKSNDGLTLIHIALAAGNFDLAKYLLKVAKNPLEET